jgi:hypothetical protein
LFSLGSDLFSLLIFFSLQILSPKTIFSQQPLNPPITSKISQKNSIKSGISGCVGSIFLILTLADVVVRVSGLDWQQR